MCPRADARGLPTPNASTPDPRGDAAGPQNLSGVLSSMGFAASHAEAEPPPDVAPYEGDLPVLPPAGDRSRARREETFHPTIHHDDRADLGGRRPEATSRVVPQS